MKLWYCTFIDVYGHRCNIAKTLQISFVVRFISTIEVIYFCQHIYCITNLPLIRRKCVSEDHNNVYFEKWNRNMISSCSVIVFVGREVSIDKWSAINFAWELFACVLKRNKICIVLNCRIMNNLLLILHTPLWMLQYNWLNNINSI